MKLYVGIQLPQVNIIKISDNEKIVREAIAAIDKKDGSRIFHVRSAEDVTLTSAFTAFVASNYEIGCLEETIRNRLGEKGVDTDAHEAQELIDALTADAHHDIMHYDVDEDYAIEEAMKNLTAEIEALQEA